MSKAGCILHVTKTVFKANKAIASGGAFFGIGTSASFYNCSFTDNFAFMGGALATTNSKVELFTSNFTNNSATEGGVFATGGNLLLVGCIMSNSTAHGNGGVGYIEENYQMNIMKSVFWFNSATHAGGVFWLRKAIVNITDSFFAINWAGISGGVIHAEFFSIININHTTCFGNKIKAGKGGVLAAERKTTVWVNSAKVQNNSAHLCGVMLIDTESVLEISYSLIYDNSADVLAGGFCILNNSLSVVINSSFRGNVGYHAGSIATMDSITYLENCTLRRNEGTVAGAILIASSDLKLSKTIENKAEVADDIHYEIDETKFINKLYTYRCTFKRGNVTIRSDITDFKQIADQKHFMVAYEQDKTNLEMKETQFASGKNFFIQHYSQ